MMKQTGLYQLTDTNLRPSVISFYDNGKEIGKLIFNDSGQLEFSGNATESAKLFFKEVIEINSGRIKELEAHLK